MNTSPVTLAELARATEDLPLEEKDNDKNDGAPAALMTSRTPAHEACKSGLSAVPGRPAEPSEADIATLTAQYRKAVNGLYEAYVFGQMLMAVKSRLSLSLTRETKGEWHAPEGSGIKGWLAEHCPEINYSTARRFLSVAENTRRALATQAAEATNQPISESANQPSEAQVRAFLEGKSQRAILRRGGARAGAGRKAKDYAKALDANGEVAWHEIEEPLAALFTLTAKGVAKGVLDTLNDPELQHLAYAAVKAAAENGLKGNEAFDVALSALTVKLRQEGRELSTSLRETLVQNAYIVFKNTSCEL